MRFFKKTLFWFLLFAVFGGSFYLWDRKSEEKKAQEEVKKKLFYFEPKDVSSFTIRKRGSNEVVTVKRENSAWVLSSPVEAAGDNDSIEKFLDKLVNAKIDGILFEKAPQGKLEEMGLKDPYLSVDLATSAGPKTISFGEAGPTHNVAFAVLKDDTRIFRVHTDVRADAEKESYDLRDKVILPFEPTKVKSMDVKWTGGNRILVEQAAEGKWNTIGLPEGKTNFLKLMETLVKFRKNKIKAFIDENPKDLAAYGLKDPRLKIIFVDEKGTRHTVLIGERDRQRRGYFAMRGGEKNVFLVEEDLVDSIPRSIGDLEEKDDGAKG